MEDVQGNITFSHVCFGYYPDKIILKDFSAEVKEGQKIAIVGPSTSVLVSTEDVASSKIKSFLLARIALAIVSSCFCP